MKSLKFTIVMFIAFTIAISFSFAKQTPKGSDLSNHYGTEPVQDKFGPKPSSGVNLRREGAFPGAPVTPITNYEAEINNSEVVAGDLTNTSPDASKIIKAPLASNT
jgi:hypothetical protein